mmetsp:Transcript_98227/g.174012  ORF Transcript_98227/g.174012 Transcript_98227/m.174012 type:complete len:747 (-) Transcript_98227:22-2262(-)
MQGPSSSCARQGRRRSFAEPLSPKDAGGRRRSFAEPSSPKDAAGRRRSSPGEGSRPRRKDSSGVSKLNLALPTECWNTMMPMWTQRTILRTARETLSHSQFQERETALSGFQLASTAVRQGVRNTAAEHRVVEVWKQVVTEEKAKEEIAAQAPDKSDVAPPIDALLREFEELRRELDNLQEVKAVTLPADISVLVQKMNLKMLSLERLQAMAVAHSEAYANLKREMGAHFDSLNKMACEVAQYMQRMQSVLQEEVKQAQEDPKTLEHKTRWLPVVSHCLIALGVLSNSLDLHTRACADPSESSDHNDDGLFDSGCLAGMKLPSGASSSGERRTGTTRPLRSGPAMSPGPFRSGPDMSQGGDDAEQDGRLGSDAEESQERLPAPSLQEGGVEETPEQRPGQPLQGGHVTELCSAECHLETSQKQRHEQFKHHLSQPQDLQRGLEVAGMQEHEQFMLRNDENSLATNYASGFEEVFNVVSAEDPSDSASKSSLLDCELLPRDAHSSQSPTKARYASAPQSQMTSSRRFAIDCSEKNLEARPSGVSAAAFGEAETLASQDSISCDPGSTTSPRTSLLITRSTSVTTSRRSSSPAGTCCPAGRRASAPAAKTEFAVMKPSKPKPRYRRSRNNTLSSLSNVQQKLLSRILRRDSDCSTLDLVHIMGEDDAAERSKQTPKEDDAAESSKQTPKDDSQRQDAGPQFVADPGGRSAKMRNVSGGTPELQSKSRAAAMMNYSLPALVGRSSQMGL